jgi:vancomycin resistance protein YoaR
MERQRKRRESRDERVLRIKKERVRQRRRLIGGTIGLIVLVICAVSFTTVFRTVRSAEGDTILDHVWIDGVDVSGMTEEEATAAVTSRTSSVSERTLTLTAGKTKTEVKLSELGIQVDSVDNLVTKAMAYGHKGGIFEKYKQIKSLKKGKKEYYGTYTINRGTTRQYLKDNAVEESARAQDATITHKGSGFEVTEAKEGISLDMEASLEAIESFLNTKWDCQDGEVTLVTTREKPEVTAEDLESIQDVLGTWTTTYSTALPRATNVANGAGLIDGTILMPGEEISVEGKLSPLTAENGYVEATAYASGKVVPSMAGGICQVSTTLYNAVLLAELKVTERYPHSMLVDYADPAADAAISEGSKDFKFKNNLDTPIYIECTTGGGEITATIYGKETRDANRKVSYESEVISTSDPGVEYEASADYALGSMQTTSYGSQGKTAKLWKIVTVDGKEQSREEVNTSNYAVKNQIITVGCKTDSATARNIIRDAVATQNADTIRAAISRARAAE